MNGADLKITVIIDQAQLQEMLAHGMSEKDIETEIKNAITLKEPSMRPPVKDIISVDIIKFY